MTVGTVHITKAQDGTLVSVLDDRDRVVLENKKTGTHLELRGRSQIGTDATASQEGTYLSHADYARYLRTTADDTVRPYTWRDTLSKVRSKVGLLLLSSALVGVLTAVVAILGLWLSEPQSSASAITTETVLVWAEEPLVELDSPDLSPQQAARIRRALADRALQANLCLQAVDGHPVPPATILGMSCSQARVPWYRSKVLVGIITGVFGLLTALLAVVGVWRKFGFQQSPVS